MILRLTTDMPKNSMSAAPGDNNKSVASQEEAFKLGPRLSFSREF
jgi:hypothetical protein